MNSSSVPLEKIPDVTSGLQSGQRSLTGFTSFILCAAQFPKGAVMYHSTLSLQRDVLAEKRIKPAKKGKPSQCCVGTVLRDTP